MDDRYTVYPRTLVFLIRGDEVLLVRRPADAPLFPGLFNGVGGHVERGEDILSAALREVQEETGLRVETLHLRAVLSIAHAQRAREDGQPPGDDAPGALVFVFVGHAPADAVTAGEAGELVWVPLERLRELPTLPDLPDLLPRLLEHHDATPLFLSI
ncbi:MAG: NUDIX domain-containing protein [Anaerolineae bacterium]|nr:NUDIX domain-containing protein [Anaerolineae bacterium]MDW8071102.1 NUDIX domain-containing protein [Anaerolineae bacterium]